VSFSEAIHLFCHAQSFHVWKITPQQNCQTFRQHSQNFKNIKQLHKNLFFQTQHCSEYSRVKLTQGKRKDHRIETAQQQRQ